MNNMKVSDIHIISMMINMKLSPITFNWEVAESYGSEGFTNILVI